MDFKNELSLENFMDIYVQFFNSGSFKICHNQFLDSQ